MTDSPDFLRRFMLEHDRVNGVLVRLETSWQQVRERAEYPDPAARVLAEALAASALLTGNIKFQGSLSIQLKDAAPLTLVFAECSHAGKLRGLARWHGEITTDYQPGANPTGALLAITIDNTTNGQRYQGLVAIEHVGLAKALEHYFERSEQLPTRIILASDNNRCAGLMLQQTAMSNTVHIDHDPDAWNRVSLLLDTLTPSELLNLPAEQLLLRLFHQESIRIYTPRLLGFGCSCSRERVASMLHALGSDEAYAALRDDGAAEIICEFCNTRYRFDSVDLEQLFHTDPPIPGSHSSH